MYDAQCLRYSHNSVEEDLPGCEHTCIWPDELAPCQILILIRFMRKHR